MRAQSLDACVIDHMVCINLLRPEIRVIKIICFDNLKVKIKHESNKYA